MIPYLFCDAGLAADLCVCARARACMHACTELHPPRGPKVTRPPRSTNRSSVELHTFVTELVESINGSLHPSIHACMHACTHSLATPSQVTNPPRSTNRDIVELHTFVTELVEGINRKYSQPAANYTPVHYLERHVPLHERMAFYRCARARVCVCARARMCVIRTSAWPFTGVCILRG